MTERLYGRTVCDIPRDPAPLPPTIVPGMSYVPYQEWTGVLHSPERALEAGTLFPALEKPFFGRRDFR